MYITKKVEIPTTVNFEFGIDYISESKPEVGSWTLILRCYPNIGSVASQLGISENRLKAAAEDTARLLGAELIGIPTEMFTMVEYSYPGPRVVLRTEHPGFSAETIRANWKKLAEASVV